MIRLALLSVVVISGPASADITDSGQLVIAGTATIGGNAFSVGASTVVASGGRVGVGTASPATKLHLSSGTFTIDGSGAAISVSGGASFTGTVTGGTFSGSGSGLTSLNGGSIQAGSIDTATIGSGAVNSNKLLAAAVQTAHIAYDAVDTNRVAADAIVNSKILNATIDPRAKLASGGCTNSQSIRYNSSTGAWDCFSPSSGDVSASGNNTFTGTNTFSSAQMVGGGLMRQYASSTTVSHALLPAAQIPQDDTIPQLSEGFNLLTATVTAKNANSKLMFDANINYSEYQNVCDFGVLCLFQDAGSNAVACNGFSLNTTENALKTARLHYVMNAPDTTAHVYTLKIGTNANTSCIEINGIASSRSYGGTLISTFEIIEFEGR